MQFAERRKNGFEKLLMRLILRQKYLGSCFEKNRKQERRFLSVKVIRYTVNKRVIKYFPT